MALSAVGAFGAITSTTLVGVITSAALAAIGFTCCMATITVYYSSHTAGEFRRKIGPAMTFAVGGAVSSLFQEIARVCLSQALFEMFSRRARAQ